MSLFARILSHGFALVVVVLLALALVYRGDLFPGMELPDFLKLGDRNQAATEAPSQPAQNQAAAAAGGTGEAATVESASPGESESYSEIMQQSAPVVATVPEQGTSASSQTEQATGVPPIVSETDVAPAMTETSEPPVNQAAINPERDTASETSGSEAYRQESASADAPASDVDTASAGVQESPTAEDTYTAQPEGPGVGAGGEPSSYSAGADTTAAPQDSEQLPNEDNPVTSPDSTAQETVPTESGSSQQPGEHISVAGTETTHANTATQYQMLASAREAYWLRDYATAEQRYRSLIDLDPDNPDGYGELGNMYFSQGEWDKASAMYYEAGTRLVKQGMIDEATQMMEIVRELKGSQADQLQQEINEAMTSHQ